VGMVSVGQWLDVVISVVFSNLIDSMVIYKCIRIYIYIHI